MAINTIKLTGVTVYMGQGSFLFYKKSSTGITNTDVDVFVDNNYITTMSPTDHFNVDRVFGQIRLVPADLNNQAIFISADKAEEYGTAAVAGTVAISNTPNIVVTSDYPAYLLANNSALVTSIASINAVGTAQLFGVGFFNPSTNTRAAYVNYFAVQCYDSVTGDFVPVTAQNYTFGSHTAAASNSSVYKLTGSSNLFYGCTNGNPVGFVASYAVWGAAHGDMSNRKIRVAPGQAVVFNTILSPSANSKNCYAYLEFNE